MPAARKDLPFERRLVYSILLQAQGPLSVREIVRRCGRGGPAKTCVAGHIARLKALGLLDAEGAPVADPPESLVRPRRGNGAAYDLVYASGKDTAIRPLDAILYGWIAGKQRTVLAGRDYLAGKGPAYLAAILGVSPDTASRAIARLRESGFLDVEREPYRLTPLRTPEFEAALAGCPPVGVLGVDDAGPPLAGPAPGAVAPEEADAMSLPDLSCYLDCYATLSRTIHRLTSQAASFESAPGTAVDDLWDGCDLGQLINTGRRTAPLRQALRAYALALPPLAAEAVGAALLCRGDPLRLTEALGEAARLDHATRLELLYDGSHITLPERVLKVVHAHVAAKRSEGW